MLARTLDGELAAHAERLDRCGLAQLATLMRQGEGGEALLDAANRLLLARQQRCSA